MLVRDFLGDLEMFRGATISLEYLSTSSESMVWSLIIEGICNGW
jgi:hypothetical protein